MEPGWPEGKSESHWIVMTRNHADLDPEYPFMPYGKASTLSLLAKAQVSKEGVVRVSFLPMAMDKKYRPEVLRRGDPRFAEVLAYMEWASEDMPHRFTVEGDEVFVSER